MQYLAPQQPMKTFLPRYFLLFSFLNFPFSLPPLPLPPVSLSRDYRVFRKMLYMDPTAVGGQKKNKKKQPHRPADGYIEKFDFRGHPTIIVRDFEPQVFKLLINYTHTGSVILQSSTLLGLMNAADHYGLEDLKIACSRYIERCISKDSVCVMLTTAERYIQYKSTKNLIRKILEYVDVHAEDILAMEDFANLPQHIVRIVLGREELKASESLKFDAAYQWCLRYCRSYPEAELKETFEPFVDVIDYNNIPAKHLMQRVKKSGVVDNARILTALAQQANPGFSHSPNEMAQRPLSAIPTTVFSVTDVPKLQKMPTDSAIRMQPLPTSVRFRRVQSSGNHLDHKVASQFASDPSLCDTRDVRGISVPLSPADKGERPINLDDIYLRETEVHPLQPHELKDHHSTGSSSHLSILSTPPLSPAQSLLSTESHQGSLLSVSSADSSVHGNGLSSPSNPDKQTSRNHLMSSTSQGNLKRHTYNPQALDVVVKLGAEESEKI